MSGVFEQEEHLLAKYLLVGVVVKPQGTRGEVKIKPYTDDPERFLALVTVYQELAGGHVALSIRNISVRDGMVYALLGDASTRDEAEAQRGMMLYVSRADAVTLPEDSHFITDLVGCMVEDRAGRPLGKLIEVLQPGSADVYVIKTATGRMMLPALKRVVLEVKVDQKRIVLDERVLLEVAVIED